MLFSKKRHILIYSILMSALMVFIMTALITFLNTGFTDGYLTRWAHAFIVAWPVAFSIILIMGRHIQKLSACLCTKD